MRQATIVTITTVLGLLAALLVAYNTGWTELERPPRQGEALDPVQFAAGHAVHSEAASNRLIREPQNTWTNLAFVLAGAVLASVSGSRIGRLAGWALVAVGIGSFLYHASASRTFRNFDVGAMYSLYLVLMVLSVGSMAGSTRRFLESRPAVIACAAILFGIAATVFRNVVVLGVKPLGLTSVTAVAAAVFGLALAIRLARDPNRRVIAGVGIAIGLFAVAVACQLGDRPGGWLCSPDSLVQGHAAWHVLAAAALFIGVRTLEDPDAIQSAVRRASDQAEDLDRSYLETRKSRSGSPSNRLER